MSNYIRVADISAKKVYSMGKAHSAASTLPLLLKQLSSAKDTKLVLYGDESHGFLDDKYEDSEEFEQISFDSYADDQVEWVKSNKWSFDEFDELFEEYGGNIVTPLELVQRVEAYKLFRFKKAKWIICVDAEYVGSEYYETFTDKDDAEEKYGELLELYKEELAEESVFIYFTKVIKST